MRIVTVQHAVPEQCYSNAEVLAAIRANNQDTMASEGLEAVTAEVTQFLEQAGTSVRHAAESGERPIDFAIAAGRQALQAAEFEPEDIDFVIYTGVGRGWIEPAMATVVQSELKLRHASSFDVLEACAGWLRSLQVSQSLIRTKTYRRGMIVNCECGFRHHLQLVLDKPEDVEHRLASFTIGEAATATIVDDSCPDDIYFRFRSYGEHYNLCMIPLQNLSDFAADDRMNGQYRPMKFYTDTQRLFTTAVRKMVEEFEADETLRRVTPDLCLFHEASHKASELLMHRLRLPSQSWYETHTRYGNTVSASIPLGLSLAVQEGRLHRGDRVLVLMGSAGISVGFASFVF